MDPFQAENETQDCTVFELRHPTLPELVAKIKQIKLFKSRRIPMVASRIWKLVFLARPDGVNTRFNEVKKMNLLKPRNVTVRKSCLYVGTSGWNNLNVELRDSDLKVFKKNVKQVI